MTTLVICLDRTDDVGRRTGLQSPIVGWEAVRALVTDVGLADPEDSGVNCLLESLRVAQNLRDEDEETVVAVVSGERESMVSADRAVARQLDDLIAEHDPDSAVVVIDSAEDERLVPIVESRVQVDSVDRVVVRQARDIESTYYLLKQFLADEELRQTVLVPIGLTLLVFPMLATAFGPAEGAAAITTVIGLFLLYKGFNIDDLVTGFAHQVKESLYTGQVSVVTYVVAAGLTFVGVFVGALGVSGLEETQSGEVLIPAAVFAFEGVPWLATAALTASAGRLLDEIISDRPVRASYLNLPFIVVAISFVVRGFSAYFLETQGEIDPLTVPTLDLGWRTITSFQTTAGERLAVFVLLGILVSLLGVRVAASFSEPAADSTTDADRSDGGQATDADIPDPGSESELTDGGARSPRASDDGSASPDDGSRAVDSGSGSAEGSRSKAPEEDSSTRTRDRNATDGRDEPDRS